MAAPARRAVTVAAVILAASVESALADTAGRAAVRRIVETAWSGGAIPIVVVAPDPDGLVASTLAGTTALLVAPAPVDGGPVAQMMRGIRASIEAVGDTSAALLWPARQTWVDAETVTSLLQAHGLDAGACLRPQWRDDPGWPLLLPLRHLAALAGQSAVRMPGELIDDLRAAGVPLRVIDLGDPGAVIDRGTLYEDLPPYEGPSEPMAPPPDWGAAAADLSDDSLLGSPYPGR